jgi:hypothetical protein
VAGEDQESSTRERIYLKLVALSKPPKEDEEKAKEQTKEKKDKKALLAQSDVQKQLKNLLKSLGAPGDPGTLANAESLLSGLTSLKESYATSARCVSWKASAVKGNIMHANQSILRSLAPKITMSPRI